MWGLAATSAWGECVCVCVCAHTRACAHVCGDVYKGFMEKQ